MTRLIINADDLGLTIGVNQAIFELSQARAITSATLMAAASESSHAVLQLKGNGTLGVGCHVVLVGGTPVLPASEIPTLIDPHNRRAFRTLASFVSDLLRGRVREAEIEAEAVAQIRHLQAAGVALTHVDTHKHTHMFPRVLRPLLRAALLCGVRSIRNPFEPQWSLARTTGASALRRLQIGALRTQRGYFRKTTQQAGLHTTDGVIGVLATGSLDTRCLQKLLQRMPEGTWELVCHPGYLDAALECAGTHLLASRETERQALLEVVPSHPDQQLSLIHFGDLGGARV